MLQLGSVSNLIPAHCFIKTRVGHGFEDLVNLRAAIPSSELFSVKKVAPHFTSNIIVDTDRKESFIDSVWLKIVYQVSISSEDFTPLLFGQDRALFFEMLLNDLLPRLLREFFFVLGLGHGVFNFSIDETIGLVYEVNAFMFLGSAY